MQRKTCNLCKKELQIKHFYKDRNNYKSICKECYKKKQNNYYEENKDKRLDYQKKYREQNPNEVKQVKKDSYIKNKKYYLAKSKKLKSDYVKFNNKLDTIDETRQDPNNLDLLQVKCKYCKNWFNPTYQEYHHRFLCQLR